MEMIGHDHNGMGGVRGGPVQQDLTAKGVDSSTISIVGTRTHGG
jgi:hypothetical protein